MIGHFNATDLGNKFFHDKNDCEIQDLGNGYLRCKNNTQLLIDRLYINKLIDSDQHQAGEYVLKVASRSGIFPSSVQLNAMPQNKSQPSFSSHKSMKALVLKQITKYFKSSVQQGLLSNLVIDVVCFEKNINGCINLAVFSVIVLDDRSRILKYLLIILREPLEFML